VVRSALLPSLEKKKIEKRIERKREVSDSSKSLLKLLLLKIKKNPSS